jgi:ADP-heptose:LPS heptosyltransferase
MIRLRTGRGILIVNHQGLGDAVQSLPLVKALCHWATDRYPVRILFDSRPYCELYQSEGLHFIPYYVCPDYAGKKGLLQLCLALRGTTDLIVCPPELSAVSLTVLRIALGARYSAGEGAAPFDRLLSFSVRQDLHNKPFLEAQDELAAKLGLATPLDFPSITVTAEEASWARSTLASCCAPDSNVVVGVHCAAAEADKEWPAANFGQLIFELKLRFPNLVVVSFGVRAERPRADHARRIAGTTAWVEGAGEWTIRQTLSMLQQCDLFISGDTGLMHMAAADGTRTLSIFGPTSPIRRAPIARGGVAVDPGTACHPCYKTATRTCSCIRLITVERVLALAQRCLQPSGPALTSV